MRPPPRLQQEQEDPCLEKAFHGHNRPVAALAFCADKKQLISGCLEGTVLVHSFKPQCRPFRFTGHKEAVYCLAFDPVQGLVASASRDKTVRLWHPTVCDEVFNQYTANRMGTKAATVIKGHLGAVRSTHFSPDSRLLLSTSDDKTAKLWTLPGQQCIATLAGHSNWVRCGRFSPDGSVAASASDDRSLKIWDLVSKQCIGSFENSNAGLLTLAFAGTGDWLAAGCYDGAIALWDLRTGSIVQQHCDHEAAVTSLSTHPGGLVLLSSSLDGSLKLWDLRQGCLSYTLGAHEGAVLAAAFSQDGSCMASAGADQRVLLWRSNLNGGHPAPLTGLQLPSSGAYSSRTSPSQALTPVRAAWKPPATTNRDTLEASSSRTSPHPKRSKQGSRQAWPAAAELTGTVSRAHMGASPTDSQHNGSPATQTLSANAWKGWPAVGSEPDVANGNGFADGDARPCWSGHDPAQTSLLCGADGSCDDEAEPGNGNAILHQHMIPASPTNGWFLPHLEASRLPNSPVQQDGDSSNQNHLQPKRGLASHGEGFPPSVARQQQELPYQNGASGSMELSRRHETHLETISKQLENLTALVAAHGQLLESIGEAYHGTAA